MNKPINNINSDSNAEKKQNRKTNAKFIIVSLLVVGIVMGIFALIFNSCSDKATEESTTGFVIDDGAVEGGWNEADKEKIQENLNKSVEEGYINISMNTTPVFEDGSSEGNLMIVNETINTYPQRVVISRNDTDENIYESKGIPVGSKIEKAKLSVDLPAGTYECTAMFHNVDPDTGNSLGCAGATINITVKN